MRDLMIDIETLGTAPGSVILSIGAVAFDAEAGQMGDEFYIAIDPDDAAKKGLTTDISTVQWWMQQSKEAQADAFSGGAPLVSALLALEVYVKGHEPSRVWAKPPSFDLVLLESAYRTVGYEIPWHYRTPRDLRTLIDLTGAVQPDVGTAHNALDDAKSQALAVIDGYARLSALRLPVAA